ncbi:MAG: hypothetical protein K1X40_11925 [Chitinophagales bacterium]|nr:hypothetical protein [Chitinophagales bacterium]
MKRISPTFVFALFVLFVGAIYLIIYLCFQVQPNKFGPVGDSVGGIVGPFLTLIAAYFAYQAFSKERDSLILANKQYENQKDELNQQKEKEKVQVKVDDIADSYELLEHRIQLLQYIGKDGIYSEGAIAIERLFFDLRNKDWVTSLMHSQVIRSLEACNEIFIYCVEITLNFNDDIAQKRLLVWELVLIYESIFRSNYKIYNLDEIFKIAIDKVNELKSSGSYSDPRWLEIDAIQNLYASIQHANFAFEELLMVHRTFQNNNQNK